MRATTCGPPEVVEMPARMHVPPIHAASDVPPRARTLTRWAWAMVPALVVSFAAAYGLGTAFMAALDVPEGGLLSEAGAFGWLAALAVLAVELAPVAVGAVLARRATLAGGAALAVGALVANGLLLVYLAVVQLAQLAFG